MLVDVRIEHVDASENDSNFIELVDAVGDRVQLFFTDIKALATFAKDLAIVIQGMPNAATNADDQPKFGKKIELADIIH